MKSFWNKFIQVTATVGQVANFALPIVPEKQKVYILGGLSIIQAISGMVAHNYNPDGTSVKVAYIQENM